MGLPPSLCPLVAYNKVDRFSSSSFSRDLETKSMEPQQPNSVLVFLPVDSTCVCVHSVSQPCLTLCNSTGSRLPSSSVHGLLQAKILERVAFPSSGDLPYPGKMWIEPKSPALVGRFFTTAPPGDPLANI